MLRPLVRERAPVVHQVHPVGEHLQVVVGLDHPERRHRQIAKQGESTCPVLEHAVGGVLQAQQAVGEHGDPEPIALDNGGRVGQRSGRDAIVGFHQ